MTDWTPDTSNDEKEMPNSREWVRDFFEKHIKDFSDNQDGAIFRQNLENYNINEAEVVPFLEAYKRDPAEIKIFLDNRQTAAGATEEQKPSQEPEILPFKKPDETVPGHKEDQKTAA